MYNEIKERDNQLEADSVVKNHLQKEIQTLKDLQNSTENIKGDLQDKIKELNSQAVHHAETNYNIKIANEQLKSHIDFLDDSFQSFEEHV